MTLIIGDSDEYLGRFRFDRTPVYFGFSSLDALTDHIENVPLPDDEDAREGWDVSAFFARFSGSASMTSAILTARTGWQEGLERAEAIASSLAAEHPRKPVRLHSMAGASVNVGRLLAGNPAHMRSNAPIAAKQVITLFIESAASAGVSTDILISRAAIIAAICDILENSGYSCEIVSLITTCLDDVDGEQLACQTAVKVKNAGERLNLANAVFAMGHPSFQRRFRFALVGSVARLRTIWRNQGYPASAFSLQHRPGPNEFYFPMIQMRDLEKVDTGSTRAMFDFVTPKNLRIMLDHQSLSM